MITSIESDLVRQNYILAFYPLENCYIPKSIRAKNTTQGPLGLSLLYKCCYGILKLAAQDDKCIKWSLKSRKILVLGQ
jgi:hypothetical protein